MTVGFTMRTSPPESALPCTMTRQRLPREMRSRVREYFHQSMHVRAQRKATQLLTLMSPTLQSEVTFVGTKDWLARVWFLKDAPPEVRAVAVQVRGAMRHAERATDSAGACYEVDRAVARHAHVLHRDSIWMGALIICELESSRCREWVAIATRLRATRDVV